MPKQSFIICLSNTGQARPYQLASLCLVYIYVVFSWNCWRHIYFNKGNMAHLITILRLVASAWITEWQHRATENALKFTTSGHMLLHVCMHGEASGKAFSKSGEETAEGSDFADTSSDTSNSPSPAAAASSQGGSLAMPLWCQSF